MVASIICPFTPSYGLTRAREPQVVEAQYGDGYVQRVAIGINNSKAMFTLPFTFRTDQEARDIEAFFDSLGKVTPFLIDIPGESWSVTGAGIGVGDNTRTQWQLQRTRRGSVATDNWSGVWPTYTTPRTNLLTYWSAFENAAWTKNRSTYVASSTIAPDNISFAGKLTGNNNSYPQAYQVVTVNPLSTYTLSAYVKSGTANKAIILLYSATGGSREVDFDLVAGTGTLASGSATYAITQLSNGWSRCSITVTTVAGETTLQATIGFGVGGATLQTTDYIYYYGAQLESGSVATQPIPTTSAAVTVTPSYWPLVGQGFEPVRWTSTVPQIYRQDWQGNQLLYQTARTNLWLQSTALGTAPNTTTAATITGSAGTAPDGTNTAWKLAEDNTNAGHNLSQSITQAAGVVTMTLFLKAVERSWVLISPDGVTNIYGWVNLATGALGTVHSGTTITTTALANGWWKVTVSGTVTAGAKVGMVYLSTGDTVSSYAGTTGSGVLIWHPQSEAGSVSTSDIPTTSAAVTVTDYTLSSPCLVTTASAPVTGAVMSFTASGPNRHQLVAKKWTRGWDSSGRNTITVEVEEDFS